MFEGVILFFNGLYTLLSEARLRAVLWRMIGLLAVLMIALVIGVFYLADYVAGMWIPQGDEWYWEYVTWLAWALAGLLSIISGVASFTVLATAAVAPWLDTLATRTEQLQGKASEENSASWVSQSMTALANSVRPLLGLMVYGIAALLFFWFPPLATLIWLYGSILFLNYELFDTQASRKGMKFRSRKAHMVEHKWFWLGFGGSAMAIMMIPVVNLLVVPAAVVALAKKG